MKSIFASRRTQSLRLHHLGSRLRGQGKSSYLFLTNTDLKLIRTVYLKSSAFPQVLDAPSAHIYKEALVALGKDVDKVH